MARLFRQTLKCQQIYLADVASTIEVKLPGSVEESALRSSSQRILAWYVPGIGRSNAAALCFLLSAPSLTVGFLPSPPGSKWTISEFSRWDHQAESRCAAR